MNNKILILSILCLLFIGILVSGCITINVGPQTAPQTLSITPQPTSVSNINTGTITGTVFDQNKVGIPRSRITLWQNGKIANVQNNPQITSADWPGKYTFNNVPMGNYIISAEKEGHTGYTNVYLDSNSKVTAIAIASYAYMVTVGNDNANPTLEPSWNQPPVYKDEYEHGYAYQGVSYGTIVGQAVYNNGIGVPYANVTLWQNENILLIPENPQQSNDGRTSSIGMFMYYEVPFGKYSLTAEKEGKVGKVDVNVDSGTVYVGDVMIPA